MWLGINVGKVMLGNLIWRLSGAATSSYLFSLLIQVAPPSPSKTHLRLCGCLLYWCIHFVAVTKGPSCLSSLASFFFHPYLHVECTLQLLTLLAFLLAGIQQFHESPQLKSTRHLCSCCLCVDCTLGSCQNKTIHQYIALFCWYSDSNWSRKCLVGNWCFAMFFC